MARFVHAYFNVKRKCLALRRTKCYDIKTAENKNLLLRWVNADPVGDTGLAKTLGPSAVTIETIIGPERAAPGSSHNCSGQTSLKSDVNGRLPLIEITSPQSIAQLTASLAQKGENLSKPSTPSKKSHAVTKKSSRRTKTFKTPVKINIYRVREPRRRYSDTDLSKVCL